MGNLTTYGANSLLNHVLKNTAFTRPTHLYLALCLADPTKAATGDSISEPTGGSYARVICDSWETAVARATSNMSEIKFTKATANWGTITHWAICDALTSGNAIAFGPLTVEKTVNLNDTFTVAAGDLDVSINSGALSNYLANALLDHVFKGTPFSQPANIYVSLSGSTITDATTGSTISEPADTYERQSANTWNAASGGASANTNAISFPSAGSGYGTMTDFALIDALTNGNILFYSTLAVPKGIGAGDVPEIAAGDLNITLD